MLSILRAPIRITIIISLPIFMAFLIVSLQDLSDSWVETNFKPIPNPEITQFPELKKNISLFIYGPNNDLSNFLIEKLTLN